MAPKNGTMYENKNRFSYKKMSQLLRVGGAGTIKLRGPNKRKDSRAID
jgi:hypothetical protein